MKTPHSLILLFVSSFILFVGCASSQTDLSVDDETQACSLVERFADLNYGDRPHEEFECFFHDELNLESKASGVVFVSLYPTEKNPAYQEIMARINEYKYLQVQYSVLVKEGLIYDLIDNRFYLNQNDTFEVFGPEYINEHPELPGYMFL